MGDQLKLKGSFILILVVTILGLRAEIITGTSQFDNFEKAQESQEHLKFTVESTKVGLFSSDVDGYVLGYKYTADYDEKNEVLRDLKLGFLIEKMDTDHEGRDTKLHSLCMGLPTYKKIKISFVGPVFLKEKKATTLNGTVAIRGKEKPFTMETTLILMDKKLTIKGKSIWSLKEMEIPDPSIAVAKLSDEIRLDVLLTHSFK